MAAKGWQITLMVLTIIAAIVLAYWYRKNSYFEPAPPAVPVPPPPAVPVPPPPAVPVPPPPAVPVPPPPAVPVPPPPAVPVPPPPAVPVPPTTTTVSGTDMPNGTQTSMMPQSLSELDNDISGFNKEDLSYEYTSEAAPAAPAAPAEPAAPEATPSSVDGGGVEMYVRSPYSEF